MHFLLGSLIALCAWWGPVHAADTSLFSTGLLWKIERPGTAPSHVFGTIHSEDDRVLALPDKVKSALAGASVFVMEAVMDEQAILAMGQRMMFSDGRTLKRVLNVNTYAKARAAMASYGMPEAALQQMKPWAVATTLSVPRPQRGLFLDLMLMQSAAEEGKPVAGLETADEQLAILDELSMPEQIAMLEDTLAFLPRIDALFSRMHELYLARDLAGMAALSEEMEQQGNRELGRKVMAKLLDARNVLMAQRMETYLKQGKAFIAVGALHLPGSKGLLNLLVKKGYRVSVAY